MSPKLTLSFVNLFAFVYLLQATSVNFSEFLCFVSLLPRSGKESYWFVMDEIDLLDNSDDETVEGKQTSIGLTSNYTFDDRGSLQNRLT